MSFRRTKPTLPLQTRRLVIRPLREGDELLLYPAVRETLRDLMRWLHWAHRRYSPAEARRFVLGRILAFEAREDFGMALLTGDGTFLGMIGLHRRGNPKYPVFEIGYWCRRSAWGRGYTGEALRAVTRYGFAALKARRIEIKCDRLNKASERVMIKAGFRKEGLLRHERCNARLEPRDTLIYARVR